jgi:hypothetical protein
MSKFISFSGLSAFVFSGLCLAQEPPMSVITDDNLDIRQGLPWAGTLPGWEFSRSIEVVDGLTKSSFGRVVIDRHGICERSGIICDPFSVSPGDLVLVTLWNSNAYSCSVQVVVQKAPSQKLAAQEAVNAVVPVNFSIGVGNQKISLVPAKNKPRMFQYRYQYSVRDEKATTGFNLSDILTGKGSKNVEDTYYVASTLLSIDREAAQIMSSAPEGNVRARITFADGSILTYDIGASTVREWKRVLSFNPTCAEVKSGGTIAITETKPNPQVVTTSKTDNKIRESAKSSALANVYGFSASPEDLLIAIGDLPLPRDLRKKPDYEKMSKIISDYNEKNKQEGRVYLTELAKGSNKPLSDNLRKILGRYLIFKNTGKVDF